MADANLLTPQRRLKSRLAAARDGFLRGLDSATLAERSYPEPPQYVYMPASIIT